MRDLRVHTCFVRDQGTNGDCAAGQAGHVSDLGGEVSPDDPSTPPTGYPVLAVLAPVVTCPDNELAYPGDPMCLYSALALTVSRYQHRAGYGQGPGERVDTTDAAAATSTGPSVAGAAPARYPDWRPPP